MDYGVLAGRLFPEIIMIATALIVLAADLSLWRRFPARWRRTVAAFTTSMGCLMACAALGGELEIGVFYKGMWIFDPKIGLLKEVLVGLIAGTVWINRESSFTRHVGEFAALTILAGVGGMILVSTENLLLAFVGLELLSLSLYVMTAFAKSELASVEAGVKYFLFGGVSAACLLYGLSLLYGVTGATQLTAMATALAGKAGDPLVFLAVVLVSVGLGFKVAVAPFHLWAPDTYQGAPTPAAAFVASASKVASFFLLAKISLLGWKEVSGGGGWRAFAPGWSPVWCVMAAASVVVGNIAALVQTRLKRLLAYSAIAHTGYMVTGLLANNPSGEQALVYYVITYAVASLGAFAVIAVVERAHGTDDIAVFSGLGRRAPYLAACLGLFLLSFAGIPPLAGFFGKIYLFIAALGAPGSKLSLLWLVLLGAGMSCVALYYYLVVLKRMFVFKPEGRLVEIEVHWMTRAVLGICALIILMLGLFPAWLFDKLTAR
ncbi:MAG: NADH-quinone oxidoreductase subunit N [Verrucomicrobia bacterium]|nr:NADH-quinone oxidoreductase subunit N [Verrucomicrobiota bacterium]MBI3870240.1 NADH-quinone oxidoreductase subunit N [Verrucomicrobiota bacterium]